MEHTQIGNNSLFVIANFNLNTVEFVAKSLKEEYPSGFSTIVLFESPETMDQELDQVRIYQRYFGNFKREVITLEADGNISAHDLFDVFAKHNGNLVVDLSNGAKSTTSILYMAARLCHIENIYHTRQIKNSEDNTTVSYEYVRMPMVTDFGILSKIGNFDLIYYLREFEKIFDTPALKQTGSIGLISQNLKTGIAAFFTEKNYGNVIRNVTNGNEQIIDALINYISSDAKCSQFCVNHGVRTGQRDPVGELSYFFKTYSVYGTDPEIKKLCVVPGMLSALRDYRNISSHNAKNKVPLTEDDARTVLNMTINLSKCIKCSNAVWSMMQ